MAIRKVILPRLLSRPCYISGCHRTLVMKIAVVLVLLCLSLGACGQKGPLYLPQPNKPQPEVDAPKPDVPKPEAAPVAAPTQEITPQ